jgi:hypothetical protein
VKKSTKQIVGLFQEYLVLIDDGFSEGVAQLRLRPSSVDQDELKKALLDAVAAKAESLANGALGVVQQLHDL